MAINLRVIPEWRQFASRLQETIQDKEHQSHGSQSDKEDTLYLNVHPSIQYHFGCPPSDHLQCITAYSGHSGNVVLGFQWSQTVIKHQIDMWQDDGHGNLRHHSTTPVYGRFKIERMLFVPNQRVLVGYCNDLCLRVLTDNTQEMVVLYHTQCPASIVSMHYCPETNELVTGSMGLIAFWGFWTSAQTPLSLLRILDWTRCSIDRETVVSAFVSQRQTNSIYALCDRSIKNFEHTGKHEIFEFRGQSIATLRCVVAEWRQRYLYTGDADGYVQVWSCDMRRLFLQFRAHATAVTSVVLLAESGSILTASTGRWIKQWTRSGDLLLKLHVDMPGGVKSMWKLSKNIIMCQSSTSLDVWRLNSIYRSFNDTACTVRVLRRMECSRNKGQILAVTLDGIIRFLSPVTGELLFLSWPFLHIDKALGFAYDPSEEELYVCDGSVEVLVLNTTLSPCPVKHIINTVKEGNDGVLCLETVTVWSLKSGAGDESAPCLVFSGHRNGKLQLLAPLGLLCEPQRAHKGAICQMSSLSRRRPSICCYGADCQFTVWSVGFERCEVHLSLEVQISCDFTPVHSRLMRGFICAVSPQQHLVFYSVHGDRYAEGERKKSEQISCLDYCPQLDILALTGDSGKIELWNHEGDLVAEIQLGVPVTQVCFGNARGDILASFAESISIIPATHALPASYLRTVLGQAPTDDIVELPIPFLPKSPVHYDMCLVPKIYLKYLKPTRENVAIEPIPDQTTTESFLEESMHTEEQEDQTSKSVIKSYLHVWKRSVVRIARKHQTAIPKVEPDERSEEEVPTQELVLKMRSEEDFLFMFSRIAPDGYIPNSVIRAKHIAEVEEEEEQEEEYSFESVLPQGLFRTYEEEEVATEHTQAIQDILTRAKVTRTVNVQQATFKPETPSHREEEAQGDGQVTGVTLEEIEQHAVEKVYSLLGHLNVTCELAYKDYSKKLIDLLSRLRIDKNLRNQMKSKFVSHAKDSSLLWRQQEGLRNLQRLQLLYGDDVDLVGSFLVKSNPGLRDLARNILKDVFQITDKQALATELEKTMSLESLKTLLDRLTDNLELIVDPQTSCKTADKNQLIKTKDRKGSKRRTSSVKPEDNQLEVKQISPQYPPKARRYSKGTSGVSKEEKDNYSEKEMNLTQIATDSMETIRTPRHTPESAQQKICAVKPQSKKDNLLDMERSGALPNDPLLYAFRKARKYAVPSVPPMDLGVPKYESHLLPSDSGLGSLVSQEVSSEKIPSGGAGGSLPITKHQRLSRYFRYGSQHPEYVSEDPHHTFDVHTDDDMTTKHPHHTAKRSKQHLKHLGQHPRQTSQHSLKISQYAQRISQHPRHISRHPQETSQQPQGISQHPKQSSQESSHFFPQPLGLVSDEESSERSLTLGEGDPHWRESLHKLIALHGFRSKKAARQASSLCAQPLRLQPCVCKGTRTFPRPQCQPHWQGALGERVTQSTEVTGAHEDPSPTRFQHELPLPWRLGHFPLNSRGQVKYGKLEMDWVRTDDSSLCQAGRISLPKINPKGSLIQTQ